MYSTILTRLPGDPIITLVEPPGANVLHDMREGLDVAIALVDSQTEPVFLIIDITGVAMRIDQVRDAANIAAGDANAFLHHPNLREVVFVTQSMLLKGALRILGSTAYHELQMHVADSMEEALAYCRAGIESRG